MRQRQRLIDATIAALHQYGPTGTTVARVVAIAQLSPGIVRFYFRSKAAMLVAALQYLATEFEERVMVPVAALRDRPALALERLVDLYLDPDIASPRKVAVWYAFWGEASAREEYLAICGQKDANFAALVHELVAGMIEASGRRHLDADAVALGLIGVLEMLWQAFAFEEEAHIDRAAARRRCLAYLRSVFPRDFGPAGALAGGPPGPAVAAPRDAALRAAWWYVGHECELPGPAAVLATALAGTRVLVVRDGAGELRAFRNACRQQPHALVTGRTGTAGGGLECALHGLAWDFAGQPRAAAARGALAGLELRNADGLLFVRVGAGDAREPRPAAGLARGRFAVPAGGSLEEFSVAASWHTVVEQWLESRLGAGGSLEIDAAARTIVAREAGAPRSQFFWPATLVERHPDGLVVLQALPAPGGGSRVQRYACRAKAGAAARGRPDAAAREWRAQFDAELALAVSTEQGYADPDYAPDVHAVPAPAVAAFRRMAGSPGE